MPPIRTQLPSAARTTTLEVTVGPDGTVTGKAPAGAHVELANLSVVPTGFVGAEDVVERVVASADGSFTCKLPDAQSGDVLQVFVRADASAPVQDAVQLRVQAENRADDPRAAFVSLRRVRVEAVDGALRISPRTSLPVTEPGALVRFTNTRTGASVDAPVDPLGRFTPLTLEGAAGDTVDVSVSDAPELRAPVSVGALVVGARQVQTPKDADGGFSPQVTIPGRLFLTDLLGTMGLAKQGSLGNCPVPAGASAIAAVDPDAIRDLIRDNGDGTYTVTFHPANQAPVEITVDGALYGSGQSPRYGIGESVGGEHELWFPLVEKAYAAHVGGYDVLGKGTSVGRVLQDFLGRDNKELWLANAQPDDVWLAMKRARTQKKAMAAGTYPSSESARYRGTGVYANHAYSVLALEERADGKRLVTLRNPWGGAAGYSGVFQLPIEDFVSLYQVLNIC